MPPSGITALVEFFEPSEARKAFTKLAYTKYKHLPLYLEWAPDNTFTAPLAERNKPKDTGTDTKRKEKVEMVPEESGKQPEPQAEPAKDANKPSKEESEDEDEPEPDTTLFVKNINFSTTEEQLKKVFTPFSSG